MSYLTLADGVTPATPAAAKTRLYTQAGRLADIKASGITGAIGGSAPWNLLRNSGFWFCQRQAPATNGAITAPALGSRGIGPDGWGIAQYTATTNYFREDTAGFNESNVQSRFYGAFNRSGANGQIFVTQVLDGVETDAVRGRFVRLTFKLKCGGTSPASATSAAAIQFGLLSYGGTVDAMGATLFSATLSGFTDNENFDPALVTNWSYVAPAQSGDLNSVAGPNSYIGQAFIRWQTYSGVFFVPTTAKNIAIMIWSSQHLSSSTGSLHITDAMLTDGSQFYDFAHIGMANEYTRVARFYQKSFNIDAAPQQALGANTGEAHFPARVAGATAFAGVGIVFPVRMYKVPTTLTLYNPAAAGAQVRNVTLGTDCTVSAITADSETGAWVNATAPASTVGGNNMAVHWTADGEL